MAREKSPGNAMQTTQCKEFQDYLSAFADGELDAARTATVRAHVDTCAACQAEVRSFADLKRQLRGAVNAQPMALGLETRIRARLNEQPAARGWWARPAFATGFGALALVVVTAGGWLAVLRPMQNQVAGLLAIGRGDHVHCTLERKNPPVGALNRPLPKHHGDIVPVAQASLPGFSLLENHTCRFRGRQFTHIVFGKAGQRVSVIVTAKHQGESLPKSTLLAKMRASGVPVYQDDSGSLRTAMLETADSWAYVVSDLDEKTNLNLMARLGEVIPQADRQ